MKVLRKGTSTTPRNSSRSRIRSADILGQGRKPSRGRVNGKGQVEREPREGERHILDARYSLAVRKFDDAARAFRRQDYARARELFGKLASGEVHEVAERARVHLQFCNQRLRGSTPRPKSAEEYYTLGVGALNTRHMREAIEHLGKADKLTPNQEHIQYALATAHALEGNVEAALEHLKSAITLRPANRIQARHDEDLAGLATDPRFRRLVTPESF
jgi:tetratricopeptide (TPR) repeat protein